MAVHLKANTVRARLYEAYATEHAGVDDVTSTRRNVETEILPHLDDSGSEVLDIGCGQGTVVGILADQGFHATGIDISPEQVEIARSRGINVILGDYVDYLDLRKNYFSAVIAIDLLEHLSKDEILVSMDSIQQALKPGGKFICRAPNALSPLSGRIVHGDLTHENAFTPSSVKQLCKAVRFSAVDIYPCPPTWHGAVSGIRLLVWKVYSALVKTAYAAETGMMRGHIVSMNLLFCARK